MDSQKISTGSSPQHTSATALSALGSGADLHSAGLRFVLRGDAWMWVHPLEKRCADIDCTDMDDAAFNKFVADQELPAVAL